MRGDNKTKTNYLQTTFFYEEAERRYNEISKHCLALKKRIDNYPQGKIHVLQSRKTAQYYLRIENSDKSGIYLPKGDKKTIQVFLQKKYDEKIYEILKLEKECLGKILKKSKGIREKIQSIYTYYPDEAKELIAPIDVTDEEFVKEWQSETFTGKEIDLNAPIFITNKGEHVRSKSELNIANMLYKLGIPYRYEAPISLHGERIIYPDFTVLNVKKRKVIYWEHRGMMDDREYAKHSVQRIKMLAKEDIILGDNLVISEETQSSPLGTDEIITIIEKWFM